MSNIKGRDRGSITSDELKLIQDQQNKVNSILVEIGYQESRKHALLHDLAETNEIINNTKKQLESKYGHIDIDLTTGEWKKHRDVEGNKED